MRTVVGVLAASALAVGTLAGAASTQGTEAALIANERALYDSLAKGDTQRFRALTLPDGRSRR